MKRMSKAEAEAALRAGNVRILGELPDGIDTQLIVDAIMSSWGDDDVPFFRNVARNGQDLPEPVIRGVLERLKTVKQRGHATFILEAIRTKSEPLQKAWGEVLRAYLEVEVNQEAWGSKLVRERIATYAKSPYLPAFQAAVVAGADASMRFLAVLAHDASEDSLDALLTRFSVAADERSAALSRLEKLKTHAADTPLMNEFFEAIERRLTERTQSSGVFEFMKSIGIEVDAIKLRVTLTSADGTKDRLPSTHAWVIIDSSSGDWFQVDVSRRTSLTTLTSTNVSLSDCTDKLGLGGCKPSELPQWLQQSAKKLKITWSEEPHFRGTLRGKKRQQFIDWMLSE